MAIESIKLIDGVQIFEDVILKCELIIGKTGPDETQVVIRLEDITSGEAMEISELLSEIERLKKLVKKTLAERLSEKSVADTIRWLAKLQIMGS